MSVRRIEYDGGYDFFYTPTEAGVKLVTEAMEHGRRIHDAIEEAGRLESERTAYLREGMCVSWLRHNLPWYYRWVIGYPGLIRALDWLGLIVLPVMVFEKPKPKPKPGFRPPFLPK